MNNKVHMGLLENFKLSKIPFLSRTIENFSYGEFQNNKDLFLTAFYSRQIVSIVGAAGTGKSSLIFYSINELDPSEFRVVTTELSNPNKGCLYKTIAMKLGIRPAYKADDIKMQIMNFFNEQNMQGKFNCLIIDEAHSLTMSLFDELRSLYDESNNFSLVLSGLPSLNNLLNLSVNIPLKQRITLMLECTGLSLKETKDYILHQLDLALARNPIFDEKSFPLIHSLTSGAPRKINQLCYGALIEAYKENTPMITEEIIKKVQVKLDYGK